MSKPVPGPKGLPVLGSLPSFMGDVLRFVVEMREAYGAIARYKLLSYDVYQLNDPDYIQEVLVGQAEKFRKGDLDKAILSISMGNGLVVNDGDSHRYQRKLMQPAFHTRRIENYAQIMSDYTGDMLRDWERQTTLNIHRAMTDLTLRIVSKTLYDADVAQKSDGVGEAVEAINHIGGQQFRMGFVPPMWLPLPQIQQVKAAVRTVDNLLLPIIAARRSTNEDRGDLLSMLLMAQDEDGRGMSDRQIRDEVVTLFLAGHETTSNALTWTWVLLSQNPDVEAKLHAELDSVLQGRAPTLADLKALPYTERVIKESMRVYPPVWSLNARQALEDVTIDGYRIPKGGKIFILPYVIHRDPRYYADPERFMPERWTETFEKGLPRYAYLPFGGGARVCIGNSFAMMEARLLLATIAQRYRVRITTPVALDPAVTLHPRDAVTARLEQRVPQAVEPEAALA
jgi:cytochrome P450